MARTPSRGGPVPQAVSDLIALGRHHGYTPADLARLVEEAGT